MSIRIYTKTDCPYSAGAKRLLDEKGLTYEEINISDDPHRLDEMMEESGRDTTPQIFFGDHFIGGYDELQEIDRTQGVRTAWNHMDAASP